MIFRLIIKIFLLVFFTFLISPPAWAHMGGSAGGFSEGLLHPVLGLDHFLAMISVGILSAQIGGRAIWSVPATFILVMLLGGVMGMRGVPIVSVELGIAFSVLALGITIAAEKNMPTILSILLVAVFAIFHGHAHGTEMPIVTKPYLYALGFVTGTASIHIIGVFIGFLSKIYTKGPLLLRYVGAGIAGVGFHLLVGPYF